VCTDLRGIRGVRAERRVRKRKSRARVDVPVIKVFFCMVSPCEGCG